MTSIFETAAAADDLPTGEGAPDIAIGAVKRGSTLTEKVYGRLRHALLRGLWEPGEKITARSISREVNVSLTPVREAMMKLANEGALEVSETRAFIVPLLDREQYREVARIQMPLEPLATESALPFVTPKVIDRLEELNETLKELIERERFKEALQTDSEFHHTIYDQAGEEILKGIIDTLWVRVGPTRNLLSHTYRKRLVGYQNHKDIIAALREGDAEASRQAVHKDISMGAASLCEALQG